jgi:hypothetical protein|tara:strand:- start:244 stop:1053 length:810 start_codon:yes stop_codon:yes gene_type:complete
MYIGKIIKMIFLSKNGTDEYVNMFAEGCNAKPTSDKTFDYDTTAPHPIVLRGILKHKIMKKCWEDKRDFYYMDSGYLGNYKSPINPNGWKWFHRIVKNDLQHNTIIDRPSDRWEKLQYKIPKWKKDGRNILVVMPSEKPAKFYNIDMNEWREQTISKIKEHTDRPIVVREKASRPERIIKTIYDELDNAHAVVTLQSIAATEAVLYGVPAFGLAPNASTPVASNDITKIETPYYPDSDLVHKWACHLAYGQYHIQELYDGTARRALNEN